MIKLDMRKAEKLLVNIILAFLGFIVLVTGYWQLYPYEVLDIHEGHFHLDNSVYIAGENLEIGINFCKMLDYPEVLLGEFVDGIIYTLPNKETNLRVDCYETTMISAHIPANLPAGEYKYVETVQYRVNPIRIIEYKAETGLFTVVEKK